jgi:zinc protease
MKRTTVYLVLFFYPLFIEAQVATLKVQKYILENGFTIYLNEDKSAKDVYGTVVVKAGSKNNPADATGIAHYLEHLLFKGTTELGTLDFEKEKPFLDSINIYYDQLSQTKDQKQRLRIQQLINNQSVLASKYGLPTEFDKMIKDIGGTQMNASTTNDFTVYYNEFPPEQIDKWLDLYSVRFQHPVFRSFQSELEVVYEEKNRAMDNFMSVFEELNRHLFKNHPYGTQSTIGTVEHLKNPSLSKMYKFFETNYVANNMALILSGNFDSQEVLPIIREKFSKLKSGNIPKFPLYPRSTFKGKELVAVHSTPIKVAILGYKTFPNRHPNRIVMDVLVNLLRNTNETGLLDKLHQEGKLLQVAVMDLSYNDDGAIGVVIVPKLFGQSFDDAERLIFNEICKLKDGDFSDEDFQTVKTNMYVERQKALEDSRLRIWNIAKAFTKGVEWEDENSYSAQLEKVTKEDVMNVAKEYLGNDFLAFHSNLGFPKKEILRKPNYKSVITKQEGESNYMKKFKKMETKSMTPKLLEMDSDVALYKLNESNKLYVSPNPINDIFTLKVEYKVGKDTLKYLDLASYMISFLHPKHLSLSDFKRKCSLIGLTYSMNSKDDRFSISFTGLDKNFNSSLKLINDLLIEPTIEDESIKTISNHIESDRKMDCKIPGTMGWILSEYARFGKKSPYIDRVSIRNLKQIHSAQLANSLTKAFGYNAVWHYVGCLKGDSVRENVMKNINLVNNKTEQALSTKKLISTNVNTIYVINEPKAVQSQVYFLVNSKESVYSPILNTQISAFNEYMCGGFSGLIMQEIREYRSLAYATWGNFVIPQIQNKSAYFQSFIGCQTDKTLDAIKVMTGLINDMPAMPERMESINLALKNRVTNQFPSFREVSSKIDLLRQQGYSVNPLKEEYNYYDKLNFKQILDFHSEYIKGRPITITIYGNVSKINFDELRKFGKIVRLSMSDVITK